jgi:hypothetical protein
MIDRGLLSDVLADLDVYAPGLSYQETADQVAAQYDATQAMLAEEL